MNTKINDKFNVENINSTIIDGNLLEGDKVNFFQREKTYNKSIFDGD